MDPAQQFAALGLDENLSRAYLAALELGEATVQVVAKKARLGRTTAYHVLARLESEGLIRIVAAGGRRRVIAEDPVVLLQRLESRRETIAHLLPQLRSMYNRARSKPEIRYYEGAEGIRTVLWDTLGCRSKTLRGILSMVELIETPGLAEIDRFLQERVKRGIFLKVLRSAARDVQDIWPTSKEEMRELRYAPPAISLSMTTFLYDDKVAFISSKKENYGMIFQSEEFAQLHGNLFDGLWTVSQPAPPEPQRPAATTRGARGPSGSKP